MAQQKSENKTPQINRPKPQPEVVVAPEPMAPETAALQTANGARQAPPPPQHPTNRAMRQQQMLQIQKRHGNAHVQRMLSRTARGNHATPKHNHGKIQREDKVVLPEDSVKSKAGPIGAIDADDKKLLGNAQQLLIKASANIGKIDTALSEYISDGMTSLDSLHTTFDETCKLGDTAHDTHKKVMADAAKYAAVQDMVLGAIVSQMFFFLPGFSTFMGSSVSESSFLMQRAMGVLDGLSGSAMSETTAVIKPASQVAKTPSLPSGWQKKISFYKSYAQMWRQAGKLLPFSQSVGNAKAVHARVAEAVKGVLATNQRRPDYSAQQMEKDAAKIWDAFSIFASAAPKIDSLKKEAKKALEQAAAVKPKDDKEIERQIWTRWMAGMSWEKTSTMDNHYIEKHLKDLGVWDQLGVDPGDYFYHTEEDLAWCSATAQQKILAIKGQEVEIKGSGNTKVYLSGIGEITARVDKSGVGIDRGYIVGAGASKLNTDMLDQGTLPHGVANYLLVNGYVYATVRAVVPEESEP